MAKLEDHISPSMICMDLGNLRQEVRELESAGVRMLHVDIVDGYFSPSLPMGLDVIRQLRPATSMLFDAHVMAMENDYFLEQFLDIGVHQLCFQVETERHISRKLSLIKHRGVRAGVALSPATSLATLDYALEQCDFVLLMMINPGYASFGGEAAYSFMLRKIEELRGMMDKRGMKAGISLDGRIRVEDMPAYLKAGADTFVAGTACLFTGTGSITDKVAALREKMAALPL